MFNFIRTVNLTYEMNTFVIFLSSNNLLLHVHFNFTEIFQQLKMTSHGQRQHMFVSKQRYVKDYVMIEK